jgi:recombination protein RecA
MPLRKKTTEVEVAPSARALTHFLAKMDKSYGDGIFQLDPPVIPYEVIPTGSITLDVKMGVGGWVRGRIHEVWGMEGAGKTLCALWAAREAQRAVPDRVVAFIDMEHRFDEAWAVLQGIDLKRFVKVPPETAEQVADMVKDMCRSGLFSLIVVDSIGAMIPKAEVEKDAGDAVMGKQAQIVTRMVKIAAVEADRTITTVILINQVRANVSGYGSPTTTGGGFALKHCSTQKVRISRGKPIKVTLNKEEITIGYTHDFRVERSSVSPAGRTAELTIFNVPTERYGPVGIDSVDEAVEMGLLTGVIAQRGPYYVVPGGEQVRGRDAVVDLLREDQELVMQVRSLAIATVAGDVIPNAPISEIDLDGDDDGDADDPEGSRNLAPPVFVTGGPADA